MRDPNTGQAAFPDLSEVSDDVVRSAAMLWRGVAGEWVTRRDETGHQLDAVMVSLAEGVADALDVMLEDRIDAELRRGGLGGAS